MEKKPLTISWFFDVEVNRTRGGKHPTSGARKPKKPLNPRKVDAKLIRMRAADTGFRVVMLKDIFDFYEIPLRTQFTWKEKGYIPKPMFCLDNRRGYAGLYLQYQGYYLMQAMNTMFKHSSKAAWAANPHVTEMLFAKHEASAARFRLRLARATQLDVQELLDNFCIEEVAEIIDD